MATTDEGRARVPAEHVIEGELLKERSFDETLGRDFLLWRHQAGQAESGGPMSQYVGNALNTYRNTSEFPGEVSSSGRLDLYV